MMLHLKSSFDLYLLLCQTKRFMKISKAIVLMEWTLHGLCWLYYMLDRYELYVPYIYFDKYTLYMIFIGTPDGERSDTTTSCCKRTNQYAVGNRRVSPTSRFPLVVALKKVNLLRSFTFSRWRLMAQTVDDIKKLLYIILIIEGMMRFGASVS